MAGWRLSSVPSWRRGTGILPRWALSITSWWSTSVWTAASMAGCAGIWSPTIALLPCGAHSETCLLGRRRAWLREGLAPYYEYWFHAVVWSPCVLSSRGDDPRLNLRTARLASGGERMYRETISVHGGFGCDPATKAVAPPIYQNVAYEFESAAEAAALFNLEISGYRYSRISNPTVDILEKRVAELEGGASALAVASGQAALNYAILTLADRGGSIVAPPQLYGTTHTLLAHTLRRQGIYARFALSDRAADIAPLIDETTRAVFCESVGNPAGNVCDIEAL